MHGQVCGRSVFAGGRTWRLDRAPFYLTMPPVVRALGSLAESYMVIRDRDKAVEYYEKALEVDPDFRNATIMLQRLGKR
jgi:tetratricopeptide (TPR) repeat protein